MGCIQCERRRQAAFYAHYSKFINPALLHNLVAAAYFAGLKLSSKDTRAVWTNEHCSLTIYSRTTGSPAVEARNGKITLFFNGKLHDLKHPEDAGFIIQGKEVPK
jgi:hypothetical protein